MVLSSVIATSCASDDGIDETAIISSTVRVRAEGCGPRTGLGTGTSVSDGLVITAAHVVAGSDLVEVVDERGVATTAFVVLLDDELDVAALRPTAAIESAIELRPEPGRVGDQGVIALPTADDSFELVDVEVRQRVAIRTTDIYRDADVERPGLRVALAVEPGDSGAMVHLAGGGVGIVWSRSTETVDQAWTVDLPPELLDASTRRALGVAVDTGRCP